MLSITSSQAELPPFLRSRCIPHTSVSHRSARWSDVSVVKSGIERHLKNEFRTSLVTSKQRQSRSKAPSSAISRHCQMFPIKQQIRGVRIHPTESRIAILKSCWKRVFGSQAPINRNNDTSRLFDETLA